MTGFERPRPRAKLRWLAVDFDDTLARSLWTPENPTRDIGPPIQRNIEKLLAAVELGYKPVIHTARGSTDHELLSAYLRYNEIPFDHIITGKPLAALYIDDRARHADHPHWLPED